MNKSFDFTGVIDTCGLTNLGIIGQKFTWCDYREAESKNQKKIDRAMVNDLWLEIMPHSSMTHLTSIDLDHCPLLLEVVKSQEVSNSCIVSWIIQHLVKLFKLAGPDPWKTVLCGGFI